MTLYPEPIGYCEWHEWAKRMLADGWVQKAVCSTCNRWHIWTDPKTGTVYDGWCRWDVAEPPNAGSRLAESIRSGKLLKAKKKVLSTKCTK